MMKFFFLNNISVLKVSIIYICFFGCFRSNVVLFKVEVIFFIVVKNCK